MEKKLVEELVKELPIEEVYEDVRPVVKEATGILAGITGFFNNVIMAPIHRLNAKCRIKTEAFIRDLEEKYQQIPEQNRREPDLEILVPTLENLKYKIDNDILSDLYKNLLLSTMDTRYDKIAHPVFVNIISEMNSVDAIIFEYLYKNNIGYIKSGKINIGIKDTKEYYVNALPEWLILDKISSFDIFEISRSLTRLDRLGLLTLMYDRSAGETIIDQLKQKEEVQIIFNNSKKVNSNIELKGTDCVISINEFGESFASAVKLQRG